MNNDDEDTLEGLGDKQEPRATKTSARFREQLSGVSLNKPHDKLESHRTKHIEIDCHFINEKIDAGNIAISLTSNQQTADILTKSLARPNFERLIAKQLMRRFGFQKKGEMDAIKFVGGSPSRIVAAKAIVEAGIAVIGHVGLTPQAISVLGGFRPQGRNVASAVKVYISIFSCMIQFLRILK
ncbi:uncharacterized protein [Cicer arietinum]|uniref:3-methyl-2-oxobutanoate hydroxymethyltransferase n=1 Tax=Cicer arietinum TaxID=3827 RepID=A0A3Q7YDX3_CICAR|nr:uncharacterized protein LOC101490543 [Cicer arietinum]